MSTEWDILSDEAHSESASQKDLYRFLETLPYVTMLEDRYGEFSRPDRNLFMQIYLVFIDGEDEIIEIDTTVDARLKDRVDKVTLHIAAGCIDGNDGMHPYILVGQHIARYLHWRIFDRDKGEYFLEHTYDE